MNAPKYMVKLVVANAEVLQTKNLAVVMGKSARTVRRYAQFGQLRSLCKTYKRGWEFVVRTQVAVG